MKIYLEEERDSTTHNFWFSNRFTFTATWLSSRIIASLVGSFQLQAERARRLSIIVESRKVVFFSDLIITRLRSLIRLVFDSHISFLSFGCVYHTRLLLLFLVHSDMEMFVLPFIIVQQRRVITARENTGKLTRFSLVMCSHLLNRDSPISLYGLWFIWNLKSFSRNISNSIQMSGLAKNISGEVIYKAQSDNTRNSRNGHISVIWMTAKKPQKKLE